MLTVLTTRNDSVAEGGADGTSAVELRALFLVSRMNGPVYYS